MGLTIGEQFSAVGNEQGSYGIYVKTSSDAFSIGVYIVGEDEGVYGYGIVVVVGEANNVSGYGFLCLQ